MESSSPGDGLVATVPHVYSGALLHGLFANEFCGRRDLRIALKFIRYPHEGFWILPQYIPKRLAAVFADRTGCTHCFLQWIYRRLGGWCGHRHCHMHIRGGPSRLWQILRRFFPAPDDAAQFIHCWHIKGVAGRSELESKASVLQRPADCCCLCPFPRGTVGLSGK